MPAWFDRVVELHRVLHGQHGRRTRFDPDVSEVAQLAALLGDVDAAEARALCTLAGVPVDIRYAALMLLEGGVARHA